MSELIDLCLKVAMLVAISSSGIAFIRELGR